jgi:Glyoxalase-like domain
VGSDRPDGERKPMGAGNRCALFGRTYLELLGLCGDGSVDPWHIRPLIAKYEGLHGCSFGCGDAEAVERRLREAGLQSSGVLPLQRDVKTPDGMATARFQAVHLDRALTPEGLIHIARHRQLRERSTQAGFPGPSPDSCPPRLSCRIPLIWRKPAIPSTRQRRRG